MTMKKNKLRTPILSILLPCKNEGVNIHLMLKILDAVMFTPHEIVIICDDDKDDTFSALKKVKPQKSNIKPILNKYGRGVINAIKAGMDKATGKYVLLLAVDDLGPTLAIEDMIRLMKNGCDFVSCTRYKHGGRRLGGSAIESFVSRLGNKLYSLLCGSAFSDATTGFKMFRKDIFTKKLTLESKPIGWAVVFEMAIKAQAAGLKLGEVPITSIDRLYGGTSSFNLSPWLIEYGKWFFYSMFHMQELRSNKKIQIGIPQSTIS